METGSGEEGIDGDRTASGAIKVEKLDKSCVALGEKIPLDSKNLFSPYDYVFDDNDDDPVWLYNFFITSKLHVFCIYFYCLYLFINLASLYHLG